MIGSRAACPDAPTPSPAFSLAGDAVACLVKQVRGRKIFVFGNFMACLPVPRGSAVFAFRFDKEKLMHKWLYVTALAAAGFGSFAQAAGTPEDTVRAALKTLAPDARIDEVRPAPIAGFFEVVVAGQIVYVSADGGMLVQGSFFDIPNKVDLTEKRRAELRRGLLAKAPAKQRIIFAPKGEVKHTVAVFTDIDCGYCRELHKHITEYNDRGVQIEYLMFPRAGVGSDSFRKAVATWCAKDQKDSLTKAKAGEDPGTESCVNPIEAQYNLGQQMGVTGTPTLVFSDGTVAPGYVTPDQMDQRLVAIDAGKAPPAQTEPPKVDK